MTDIERRALTEEETRKIVEASRTFRDILGKEIDHETYLQAAEVFLETVNSTPAGQFDLCEELYKSLPESLRQPMRDVTYLTGHGKITVSTYRDPIKRKSVASQLDVLLKAYDGPPAPTDPKARMEFQFDSEHCQIRFDGVWHSVREDAYALLKACWENYPLPAYAKDVDELIRPYRVAAALPRKLKSVFKHERGKGCSLKL